MISKYLLITLTLTLGFGQILKFSFFDVPIFLHDILIALLIIANFPYVFTWVKKVKFSLGFKLFLVGLVLGFIRALFIFPLYSLIIPSLYSGRLILYLGLYAVIRARHYVVPNYIIFLSGFIALAIGYLQYLFLEDMRVFQYLGWDDHLSRLTLPHFDPTYSGIMLVLFGLYLSRFSKALAVILYFPAVVLTYARSVWFSFFSTIILRSNNKFFIAFSSIILILLVYVLVPKKFGEGTNLLRTYSAVSRLDYDYNLVKKAGWGSVIFGQGNNTLYLYISPSNKNMQSHATGPNNSFIFALLTSGIVGFLGLVFILKNLYKIHPYREIIVFISLASLFNNVLFYPSVILFIILTSPTSE